MKDEGLFMFSIITTILEIIIAASSLIIAIVQVNAARAKHRETKMKNERIRVLVQNITEVKDRKSFWEAIRKWRNVSDRKTLRYSTYYEYLTREQASEEELEIYKADYETINALYKELLIFEKEFSMSYGFGRYIDFFREYLPGYENLISEVENELSQVTIKWDVVEQTMINLGEMRKQIEVYVQELRYKFSA